MTWHFHLQLDYFHLLQILVFSVNSEPVANLGFNLNPEQAVSSDFSKINKLKKVMKIMANT